MRKSNEVKIAIAGTGDGDIIGSIKKYHDK